MPILTANDVPVMVADFVLPISRAWHADMTIATGDPKQIDGKVTLSIGDGALRMNGTARVEAAYLDTVRARVIAGAGGLGKPATPKFYSQPTVKIVLTDLLSAAGETLSTTADGVVLGKQLTAWCVAAMSVADAIGLLMDELGAAWRMLADGTFWCGTESWPDSGLAFTLEREDKAHGQLSVTLEAPRLLPGVALDGRKVSYVETHVDAETVRSTAWLVTASSGDRLRDPVVAMTRSAIPEFSYRAAYRCKVASQSADLTTLDLIPDDPRLSGSGAQSVPLRHGLPGCKVQVPSGTYVLLGWMNGDPQKPFCALWEGGETVQSIQLGGNDGLATKRDLQNLLYAISSAATALDNSGSTFKANLIAQLGLAGWTAATGYEAPPQCGSKIVGAGR